MCQSESKHVACPVHVHACIAVETEVYGCAASGDWQRDKCACSSGNAVLQAINILICVDCMFFVDKYGNGYYDLRLRLRFYV